MARHKLVNNNERKHIRSVSLTLEEIASFEEMANGSLSAGMLKVLELYHTQAVEIIELHKKLKALQK